MATPSQAHSRHRRRLIVAVAVGALVVAIGVAIGWHGFRATPAQAQVGDCLSGQLNNADSVRRTECARAGYQVVGRLENKSQSDFDHENCTQFAQADAAFWEADDGTTGAILCLRAVHTGS